VPSCAGAYVSGVAGSNECPASSVRIVAEVACRTAAAAAGKTPYSTFLWTEPSVPRGCFYDSDNDAYLNMHAVGAGDSDARLLCAAATTGAPLHSTDARARTHTHAHTHKHTPPHTRTHMYVHTHTHIHT
jgi:hypothetical protein